MKKIVVILWAGLITLPAVEWDVQRVTDEQTASGGYLQLALAADGTPVVLYEIQNPSDGLYVLKRAVRGSASWTITNVASNTRLMDPTIVVGPLLKTFVAFSGAGAGGKGDIFLASDSGGTFSIENLTNDTVEQSAPVVRLGTDGTLHLGFIHGWSSVTQLRYGIFERTPFQSETVTDSLHDSYDFILDRQGAPHFFYRGARTCFWHSFRTAQPGTWQTESLTTWLYGISAAIDDSGKFHIGYMGSGEVRYLTDRSGTWQSEIAAIPPPGDGYMNPFIAVAGVHPQLVFNWWIPPRGVRMFGRDAYFSGKTDDSWSAPEKLPPAEWDKFLAGRGHCFAVDGQGFGHLALTVFENDTPRVYYARSKEPLSTGVTERGVKPHPFALKIRGSTVILTLSETSPLRLDLFDVLGRRMERIASGVYRAGTYFLPFRRSGLEIGVYFMRLETTKAAVTQKLIVPFF
jgi:hypothetical protein